MNQDNLVITIERQYGSGGREIGKMLAKRLGIPYYGREILLLTAKGKGMDVNQLESMDERRTGSVLHDLVNFIGGFQNYNRMMEPFDIFNAESETIKKLASDGPCVFFGRCANFVVKDMCRQVRVFIYSTSREERVRRIHEIDHVPMDKADEMLETRDRQRREYYKYFTKEEWGEKENYDVCLNSGTMGYEACADALEQIYKKACRNS